MQIKEGQIHINEWIIRNRINIHEWNTVRILIVLNVLEIMMYCCILRSDEMSRSDLTLATLLEKAFRIKEDMSKDLQSTQGSVLMEASARKLLENHIQTITHIVKQLSKDIQVKRLLSKHINNI